MRLEALLARERARTSTFQFHRLHEVIDARLHTTHEGTYHLHFPTPRMRFAMRMPYAVCRPYGRALRRGTRTRTRSRTRRSYVCPSNRRYHATTTAATACTLSDRDRIDREKTQKQFPEYPLRPSLRVRPSS